MSGIDYRIDYSMQNAIPVSLLNPWARVKLNNG